MAMAALALSAGGCAPAAPPAALAATARTTAALGGRAALGAIVVTPLRVEEDSRCPSEVQCIQAGTVRVAVRVREGGTRRDAVLALGRPLRLDAGWLALCEVRPYPARPGPVPRSAYRFSFAVGAEAPACAPGS
ncbi:MAG: hypothetical protein QOG72_1253 [Sphingomonadales bacterium]|jgi:hypothetical protein|nr:hypothetical protein [Sphingomonadales bacterium]